MLIAPAPGLDHDASLAAAPEPFERLALVSGLVIEALVGPVLPGFAWIDVQSLDTRFEKLSEDRLARK